MDSREGRGRTSVSRLLSPMHKLKQASESRLPAVGTQPRPSAASRLAATLVSTWKGRRRGQDRSKLIVEQHMTVRAGK